MLIFKHLIVHGLATPPPDLLSAISREWTLPEREALLDGMRVRRRGSVDWLRACGLWGLMSGSERAFLTTSPDAISEQALRDVVWLMEAAECLLWALGRVEALPPYDTQADAEHLNLLPAEPFAEIQLSATLRDPQALAAARDVAELWHWRSRTRQLCAQGTPAPLPPGVDLDDVVRRAAEQAASRGDIPAVIGGDFPAFGRAYAETSPEEWAQSASIAMERHRALNWLCGYAPRNRWQDTPTNT